MAALIGTALYACVGKARDTINHISASTKARGNASNAPAVYAADKQRQPYSDDAPLGIRYTPRHPVKIYANWEREPYSYVSDEGKPSGMHVEIIDKIFNKFHLSYELTLTSSTLCQRALENGDAHVIIDFNNYPITPGTYKTKASLGTYDLVSLRRHDTPVMRSIHLLTPEDTVAIKGSGSYTRRFMPQQVDNDTAFTLIDMTPYQGAMAILDGEVDYFICGDHQVKVMLKRYGLTDSLAVDLADIPQGQFVFLSTDSLLLAEIDKALAHLKQTQQLAALENRWLTDNLINPEAFHISEADVIITIVSIVLFVILIFFLSHRLHRSTELKAEFRAICQLATDKGQCDVIAYNAQNRYSYNLMGTFLPNGGLTSAEFEELIHPDDLHNYLNMWNLIMAGVQDIQPLTLRMHPNGNANNWRLVRLAVKLRTDMRNIPQSVYAALTDVTDQTVRQQQVDTELQQYGSLTELQTVAMAFYNESGHLQKCSQAYKQFFGRTRRGEGELYVRNTTIQDLALTINGEAYKEDTDLWVSTHIVIPELVINTWAEVRVRGVYSETGQFRGLMIVLTDIQDVVDAFKRSRLTKLDVERERFINGRFTQELCNMMFRRRMLMFRWVAGNSHLDLCTETRAFAQKLPLRDYVQALVGEPDTPIEEIVAHPEKVYGTPGHVRRQLRFTRSTLHIIGERPKTDTEMMKIFDIAWRPEHASDGTLLGAHGVCVDITEQMRNQERLEEFHRSSAESTLDNHHFLSNMTHELRTPLNAVNGFAEMLLYPNTPEERKEYVGIMEYNSRLLFNLVDNILQLSTIDMEGIHIQAEMTDFAQEFREQARQLQQFITSPTVQYRVDNPLTTLMIRVDARRIMQVLVNFVSNSAKHTTQGFIHVGYRYDDTQLTVFCRDTGCGIPQDKQQLIFDRFYKVNEYVPGIGLGLTLSRRIATAMGGTVDCYSREGEGTVMSISVPIRLKDATPQQQIEGQDGDAEAQQPTAETV